ncbi:MAG: hypothetical protein RI958_1580, partial [Actinomycetota bacterium]
MRCPTPRQRHGCTINTTQAASVTIINAKNTRNDRCGVNSKVT